MQNDIKTLQLFYAGALADSVKHYHDAGILKEVTEKKAKLQSITAGPQLKQLGINTPEELFSYFSRVFGCIQWSYKADPNPSATGKHCLLCSIAKKMNTAKPCNIYCINPFRAFLNAMNPSHILEVKETLWEGEKCVFNVKKNTGL
ncbi:MAG: hypothetical protein C0593_13775 [Marinilabiliales bacterium]|nr:MAG: hypothetical protein C0593_13775 [Marinilabiliales bacterium]